MNHRIVRLGLAAVAVAVARRSSGSYLLTGRDTGVRLSPSSALAQTPGPAPPVASAKAGGLDASFGGTGKVVTDLTHSNWDDWASALAIQADGKIVVAGGARYRVARFSSDGTLDASFGVDGKVRIDFASGSDYAHGVAMQADGKIVVVGQSGSSPGNLKDTKFALARLNSDGTLDASFGVGGKVMTDFTSGYDYAAGVAVQTDGKIVVVGTTGSGKFALARYNSDGSLDASFGVDGKVMTGFSAGGSGASAVAIQADGRIVVVGTAGQGWDTKFALARYNSDGTLDASFGVRGKVTTGFTSGSDSASGVAIQADGKIVVVGRDGSGRLARSDTKFALARYNSDGTLDATFGGDGKVTTDFTPWGDGASGVAIQADGRIVVAGTAAGQRYEDTKFALARYNSDGTLDATFGADGKVMTDFTPRGDGAAGVAIQADGRIVAAGMANSGRSKMKVALARYLAAAVGSPSTASAVAGSPSPGQRRPRRAIGDGVYLVGTDIPAGLYKGTTVSGTFGLWQIASDANGSSIIANNLTTSGQFYVQVEKGQYLKLSGVQIVNAAAAAPTKMRSSVGDGVYLVGTDIPAGRYRGTSGDYFAGSWQISRDANGTLVVSGNPSQARPFYIHVKKGQYLKLFELTVRRVK